ncbi:hypothetical protein GCU60_00995 [Blastococcus saxobsidens]|uniref:Secreted protein n=1 Tax=Blastococcus saxobsidens TaxID=138336 RepID=A0A6L9VX48_9ACTN|nr:hypothetical protein [Blastococcus saxobsidens]NEK84347.1 hypothetical protein [Blastococcus saxobsidens]
MKRVLASLGTAALAAGLVLGTAAQANAGAIRASGPYSSLTQCQYGQKDLRGFTSGVSNIQPCKYQPAYTDDYGRTLRAGWYFVYVQN